MNDPQITTDTHAALRIIDANANRAAEGLRVIEEYLRFGLNDPHLSRRCKQIRHQLATAITPVTELSLTMRDARHDVGRTIETANEYVRPTDLDVVSASLNRVQQAFRCLEEYGKRLAPDLGRTFENLRYETYNLEKAVQIMATSLERLQASRLYVLVDGAASPAEFELRIQALIDNGVDLVQLRDKRLEDRDLLARARLLRRLTRDSSTRFLMNDRPDLAVASDADGVHLGQTDMAADDARRIVGPKMLVGVSTHSLKQARQAVVEGANYIGVGPTFPSETKQFDSYPGLPLLKEVTSEIALPIFAIGGIRLDRLKDVIATGVDRVAVSSAIWTSNAAGEVVQQFDRILHGAPASHHPTSTPMENQ